MNIVKNNILNRPDGPKYKKAWAWDDVWATSAPPRRGRPTSTCDLPLFSTNSILHVGTTLCLLLRRIPDTKYQITDAKYQIPDINSTLLISFFLVPIPSSMWAHPYICSWEKYQTLRGGINKKTGIFLHLVKILRPPRPLPLFWPPQFFSDKDFFDSAQTPPFRRKMVKKLPVCYINPPFFGKLCQKIW